MLTCQNLAVSIESKVIFTKLDFTLLDKNCLVVTGRNGSGKSTLLKTICGFVKPLSGKVIWHGRNIDEEMSLYQSTQIAYLGHNLGLKKFLTVLENLSYYASCKGTKEIIPACLKHFGIEHLIDQPLHQLSQGMVKKVGLARVMLSNSRLWILDEPDNNLDDFGKEMLAKLIEVKINEGGAIVMTSHQGDINPKLPRINIENYNQ